MLEAAPEPVEPPDDERVAGAQLVERLGQPGPLRLPPAHAVGEEPVAAGGGQRVELEVEGLLPGRDPGVTDVHAPIVSKPGRGRK